MTCPTEIECCCSKTHDIADTLDQLDKIREFSFDMFLHIRKEKNNVHLMWTMIFLMRNLLVMKTKIGSVPSRVLPLNFKAILQNVLDSNSQVYKN